MVFYTARFGSDTSREKLTEIGFLCTSPSGMRNAECDNTWQRSCEARLGNYSDPPPSYAVSGNARDGS